MGCDLVVALGPATVEGVTLFGQNSCLPVGKAQLLCREPGREYAFGEKIRTPFLELSQARQTYTVLASRPEGWWGYCMGVNEHGLAAGCTSLHNKLRCKKPALTGGDLVRLILERCRSAGQAVAVLTDLVERHGQCASAPDGGDHAFLVADPVEAFAVETAGHHWVYQEIREVRAVSNVSTVRQDWNRISNGLAGHAIEYGWWPADGSKLDFAGAVAENPVGEASALRRWGRATLLLEQQNGHIDYAFLRNLLCDHYEGTHYEVDPLDARPNPVPLCRHASGDESEAVAGSMVCQLVKGPKWLPMVWYAFGPPCYNVYFPVLLDAALPDAFSRDDSPAGGENSWRRAYRLGERLRHDAGQWVSARESFGRLQAQFDQEVEEFAPEAAALKQNQNQAELQRQANLFMHHCLEHFEAVASRLLDALPTSASSPGSEMRTAMFAEF